MKNLILALVALGPVAAVSGQFYGGEFDGVNGLSSEKNTAISDSFTYDNFHWDGGPVGTVFGVFRQTGLDQIAGGEWEIRWGVSQGNGGTVILSGTTVLNWSKKGPLDFEYILEMDGGNQVLPTGDYWIGVRPIGFGSGRAFVCTTSGAGGIGGPLNDGNSFFDSDQFEFNFEKVENVLGAPHDFSYGVFPPACYADCDQSGDLDIDDFICFQSMFGLGDLRADCDDSGGLDIDDFICFQTAFGVGCP